MKKFLWKKMFLEALFSHLRKRFSEFLYKILAIAVYMRSLTYKLSQCLSANHNPELQCVICTGVTLFALVLHLNCTALSQSESSNFFMCIITMVLPMRCYFSAHWVTIEVFVSEQVKVNFLESFVRLK